MGSKRKSATKIYSTIKNFNPEANHLVDLFCGGLAIGEIFIKNGWSVVANDKNKYVVELIRHAVNGGFNDSIFTPEFITRQKFYDVIENPSKYDDWYVGYIQCIWSFGNSQQQYMFGKAVEPVKLAGHELVVNKNPELIKDILPRIYITKILELDDWHKRRLALARVSKKLKTRIHELQQLQRLEQLQQLERLQQLELYSDDYWNIKIPKEAIIYCDPPYKGTAEYKEGGFDHDKFWEWVRQTAKTNKLYISEYQAPDDFKSILSFPQKSTLQGGLQKHNNQPNECLFVPTGQEKYKQLLEKD